MKLFLRFSLFLLALAFVTVSSSTLSSCDDGEVYDTPSDSSGSGSGNDTTNYGGGGGDDGFELSEIDGMEIEEVILTSFDFPASGTFELLITIADADGQSGYLKDHDCVEDVADGDLPTDLICDAVPIPTSLLDKQLCFELADEDSNDYDYYGCAYITLSDYIDDDTGNKTVTISNTVGIGFTIDVVFDW